jgi:N-methylhydantoinase A
VASAERPGGGIRCACDTGGTFTDLLVEDAAGRVRLYKASTTPADPVQGILDALGLAAHDAGLELGAFLARVSTFVHGTTHAINAIITGNTAKTAFLTSAGHPDILVLREGGRLEPFNFSVPFPSPYVPRALTREIHERIRADGSVAVALDEARAEETLRELATLGVEAVAVCLLWSTVNPTHERRLGELIEGALPGVSYTLSHRLNPILREYRRASSTAVDASLKPLMTRYLGGLSARLGEAGFAGRLLMLTSKGGVMDVADLAQAPVHAIGSGPALAPLAGRWFAARDTGHDTAIVADTGGTTYDVSLVRKGAIPTTPETWIGERYRGHLVGFPSVDVKSIGAGGGSIAHVDAGGLLHVGPRSAGAVPGPACYGRGGTEPTVTDASLVLGHLDPAYFLGGSMKLDRERARRAIEQRVAAPLGIDAVAAATAIVRLATENMVSAIEQITVHQGLDPRGTVLIGGGGAAGLNSVAIARRLGCERVVFPDVGAALSAAGGLLSDLHADFRVLLPTASNRFDRRRVNQALRDLRVQCRRFFAGPGRGASEQRIDYFVEARYRSQVWEIEVPLGRDRIAGEADLAALRAAFDAAHAEVFAYADPDSEVDFIGWRAVARARVSSGELGRLRGAARSVASAGQRRACFDGRRFVRTPVYAFEGLAPGGSIAGPAIVESPYTTVVLDPGAVAEISAHGSLVVAPNGGAA